MEPHRYEVPLLDMWNLQRAGLPFRNAAPASRRRRASESCACMVRVRAV